MTRKLLISDANIIIDIIAGGLVDELFMLDYEFGTPDVLYEKELKVQHPEILSAGLKVIELEPKSVDYANTVFQAGSNNRISLHDCLALSLAKQESCVLLTGDARLRQYAESEGIEVKGTLWLMQQFFDNGLVIANRAEQAYELMRQDGSRLPVDEIKRQLKSFRK